MAETSGPSGLVVYEGYVIYRTARLDVAVFSFIPPDGDFPREVHMGWPARGNLSSYVAPIITLTLWCDMIEWLEVNPLFRRLGIARELVEQLRATTLPHIHGKGVTRCGKAFVKALRLDGR